MPNILTTLLYMIQTMIYVCKIHIDVKFLMTMLV